MWENSTQLSKNTLAPEARTLPRSTARQARLESQNQETAVLTQEQVQLVLNDYSDSLSALPSLGDSPFNAKPV